MRPLPGMFLEVAALACVIAAGLFVPPGLPFAAYVVVAELAATYLLHCPAHYVVGTLLGIRFLRVTFGRTALTRVLPRELLGVARVVPVPTLSTDRASLSRVSKARAAMMYASGTIASTASAIMIAASTTASEPLWVVSLAWLVALVYLGLDLVFSPKGGDLMRARAALAS